MKTVDRLHRLALRWGWPAWVGLPLLLGALLAQGAWLPRLHAAADMAVAGAAQARRGALRVAAQSTETPEATPALAAASWAAELPAPAERAQRLAQLLALAQSSGLTWRRGEFQVEPLREAGIQAYGVSLPVAGAYPALRGFIASALEADAALALEGLRVRRPTPAAPTVEAELQFTLYSRAAGPAKPP